MPRTVSPCAGPKESQSQSQSQSRTNSLGRAKDDCHTCSRTHQNCDRQRPRCGTCNNSGRVCGGYTLDLTWKAVTGGIETSIPSSTQSSPDLGKTNLPKLAEGPLSTSSPGREFKFRVGKPKRPRKRPPENLPAVKGNARPKSTRECKGARSPLNSESKSSPPLPQHPIQLARNSSDEEHTKKSSAAGGNRALHEPSDTSEEDVESLGSSEVVLKSPLPNNVVMHHRSSKFKMPPGILFSSVADKYRGVLQMCKLALSEAAKF